jgi:hypothetical protein
MDAAGTIAESSEVHFRGFWNRGRIASVAACIALPIESWSDDYGLYASTGEKGQCNGKHGEGCEKWQ